MEEPSQGLHTYALWLEHFTGTQVSDSLLSLFFNNAFPTRGGLYHQKLSHFNKFHPENSIRVIEYIQILAKINSHCIKFGDEKSLKGREINCKVQRNSLTWEIPPIRINPNSTNTYSPTGFVGLIGDLLLCSVSSMKRWLMPQSFQLQ